jgi:hypothetical protein
MVSLGYDMGKRWASENQEAVQRLMQHHNACNGLNFGVGENVYTAAEQFFFMISPESDGDRVAADDFWGLVAGQNHSGMVDADYVQAFADGVIGAGA